MAREEKLGRFASEEAALLYVERHLMPLGIWTGVQPMGDGSWRVLHDPDGGASGPRDVPHKVVAVPAAEVPVAERARKAVEALRRQQEAGSSDDPPPWDE